MFAKVMCLRWVAVLAMLGRTQAGVIRIASGSNVAVQRAELTLVQTTTPPKADHMVQPEVVAGAKEASNAQPPTVAVRRDEHESVNLAPASLDLAPSTLEGIELTLVTETISKQAENEDEEAETSTLKMLVDEAAVSRDENASVVFIADAPQDTEEVFNSAESNQKLQKSAKLLLLSTPKLSERNREQEENIDDPDELNANTDATDAGEATELSVALAQGTKQGAAEKTGHIEAKTQTDSEQKEESAEKAHSKDESQGAITRLFGVRDSIFDTKALPTTKTPEPSRLDDNDESKKVAAVTGSTDAVSTVAGKAEVPEVLAAPHIDNVAASLLVGTESNYVLVDADADQWGSFTHAESAVHLQPIVQSVEVVPTHFDEPLLVSYVHAW